MAIEQPTNNKLLSKTGLTGMALVLFEAAKYFWPSIGEMIPAGFVETFMGVLVMIFRKFSDGKTPTVV